MAEDRRFTESETLQDAAEGIPSFLLKRAAVATSAAPLSKLPSGDFLYLLRVKSEAEPDVTIFVFDGEVSEAVASIRRVMQKPVGSRALR